MCSLINNNYAHRGAGLRPAGPPLSVVLQAPPRARGRRSRPGPDRHRPPHSLFGTSPEKVLTRWEGPRHLVYDISIVSTRD